VELQQLHHNTPIKTPDNTDLGLKIGIHMGPASTDPDRPDDFVGTSVDYAARLVKLGSEGRIVVSEIVATFVRDEEIADIAVHEHGLFEIAGIGNRRIFEIVYREQMPSPLEGVEDLRSSESRTIPDSGPPSHSSSRRASPVTLFEPRNGVQIKDFELLEEIGEGGMGKVFKARHIGMGRICVLKLIKDSLLRAGNEEVLERFYQEIQLVAQLQHPNIVQAYHSSSRDDDRHFLVLEYIEGATLDALIDDRDALALGEACEIVRQTACGLQYIHEHGLVHRDLKPSNLMVTPRSGDGMVKILDLGLALLVDGTEDRITQCRDRAIGTAYYMAPEQSDSTTVDIRADIYALGCSFYHMITGNAPFEDSRYSQEYAHRHEPPPPPSTAEPLPERLHGILMKMLNKEPDDRFAEPREIVEQIERFSDASTLGFGQPQAKTELPLRPSGLLQPAAGKQEGTAAGDIANRRTAGRRLPLLRSRAGGLIAVALLVLALATVLIPALSKSDSQRVVDSEHAAAARGFLLTMPGMNGGWWFEEIPWFFPEMRQHLLNQLSVAQFTNLQQRAHRSDVTAFYNHLRELCRESLNAKESGAPVVSHQFTELFVDLEAARSFDEVDPESAAESIWFRVDKRLQENAKVSGGPRGGFLHLRALLQFKLGSYLDSKNFFRDAATAYHVEDRHLQALCISDYAMMVHRLRDYPESGKSFQSARETVPDVNLAAAMAVFSYSMEAEAKLFDPGERPNDIPQLFQLARDSSFQDGYDKQHPLWVLLASREALYYLETWQLKTSEQKGLAAVAMFPRVSGGEPIADLYFRSRQFKAMAQHFLGKMDAAEAEFEELIKWIDDLLKSGIIADKEKPYWQRLKPNLLGRLADAQLFGKGDAEKAAASWVRATTAGRIFEGGAKSPFLVRLLFKRSIAYSLSGNLNEAQHSRSEGMRISETIDRDEQVQVYSYYDDAAKAFVETGPQRIDLLVSLLEKAAGKVNKLTTVKRTSRDDMQLLLFVCDYLLHARKANPTVFDEARQILIAEQKRRLAAPLETDGAGYLTAVSAAAKKLLPQPGMP
ncbi:MAG: protein kinase, partial [Pirellulales bacterium]